MTNKKRIMLLMVLIVLLLSLSVSSATDSNITSDNTKTVKTTDNTNIIDVSPADNIVKARNKTKISNLSVNSIEKHENSASDIGRINKKNMNKNTVKSDFTPIYLSMDDVEVNYGDKVNITIHTLPEFMKVL